MTSTTLYLVRHGETVWHAENRYAGSSDVALTARGAEQAERLGRWAAGLEPGLKPAEVWASPLSRARATAAPAARALGLTVRIDADLAEVDFGSAEGRTLAELPPEQAAAFRADPVGGAFPGAEDFRLAAKRGTAALRRIAAGAPGGRVLVVAHNTLLRLVLCESLGVPLEDYRRVFPLVRNCSPMELRIDPAGDPAGDRAGDAALLAYNVPLP
ncbi:histidine phosphatase family protein [Actinomadura craniellae]|uniref:Histidine phosphatase family protein n=1 Tax=Actinomadura craniellae TaxID=2231787 RepID=A0A365HCH2_9ACTN|nr:histidine phosphatase family protein [Actinomadura craniellae]RAY16702.1 histidine phosphatase family protein [Actinomadura craniellae]